jgi:hypothetical protein
MPPTGAKSSPKNQIDHTHLHSFVADLPLAMKTAGALNQTAVGRTVNRVSLTPAMTPYGRAGQWRLASGETDTARSVSFVQS